MWQCEIGDSKKIETPLISMNLKSVTALVPAVCTFYYYFVPRWMQNAPFCYYTIWKLKMHSLWVVSVWHTTRMCKQQWKKTPRMFAQLGQTGKLVSKITYTSCDELLVIYSRNSAWSQLPWLIPQINNNHVEIMTMLCFSFHSGITRRPKRGGFAHFVPNSSGSSAWHVEWPRMRMSFFRFFTPVPPVCSGCFWRWRNSVSQ